MVDNKRDFWINWRVLHLKHATWTVCDALQCSFCKSGTCNLGLAVKEHRDWVPGPDCPGPGVYEVVLRRVDEDNNEE